MNRCPRVLIVALTVIVLLPAAEFQAQKTTLAATPPMGWNSWNLFACKVSDAVVRAAADAMAKNGMKDAGYSYINIDDCWQGQRDSAGNIQGNERFPDMKALADYVHSKGLKIGIYSSPGPKTCAGYEGSYQHEEQDAQQLRDVGLRLSEIRLVQRRPEFTRTATCPRSTRKWETLWGPLDAPSSTASASTGLTLSGAGEHSRAVICGAPTRDIEPNYNSIVALGFGAE